MADIVSVTVSPPFRDVLGRFAKADANLKSNLRERMRSLGRLMVGAMQEEAPKREGAFAKGITFRTFEQGNDVTVRVYTPQPLGKFIIEGTKPHKIQAKNVGALGFFWPKVGYFTLVPKAGFSYTGVVKDKFIIGKGFVNHPGTKPNPFQARAYANIQPTLEPELRKLARDFVTDLK